MTTLAGLAAVVSALVATVRLLAAVIVCAGGFVMPAILSVPSPLFVSAHEPPDNVIVTVGPDVDPLESAVAAVAVQLDHPAPVSVTVGAAGGLKPLEKPTLILLPPFSVPAALALRPVVPVRRA